MLNYSFIYLPSQLINNDLSSIMCQALLQALGTHQIKILALLKLTFEMACGTGSGGGVGEGEMGTSNGNK